MAKSKSFGGRSLSERSKKGLNFSCDFLQEFNWKVDTIKDQSFALSYIKNKAKTSGFS